MTLFKKALQAHTAYFKVAKTDLYKFDRGWLSWHRSIYICIFISVSSAYFQVLPKQSATTSTRHDFRDTVLLLRLQARTSKCCQSRAPQLWQRMTDDSHDAFYIVSTSRTYLLPSVTKTEPYKSTILPKDDSCDTVLQALCDTSKCCPTEVDKLNKGWLSWHPSIRTPSAYFYNLDKGWLSWHWC
jgi:hypothetical protein